MYPQMCLLTLALHKFKLSPTLFCLQFGLSDAMSLYEHHPALFCLKNQLKKILLFILLSLSPIPICLLAHKIEHPLDLTTIANHILPGTRLTELGRLF